MFLILTFIFVTNCLNTTQNDITALNFALTLENLEATFYNTFLSNNSFNETDFINAGYSATDYTYFMMIKNHENSHVSTLSVAIAQIGGSPVPVCTYNFSMVTNVSTFVGTAKALENTGVSAYDGAIDTISSSGYRTVAATIATIEARHAAFLNQLEGQSPFPEAFDTALPPDQIVSIVSAFIISCPYTITTPQVVNLTNYPTNQQVTPTSTGTFGVNLFLLFLIGIYLWV